MDVKTLEKIVDKAGKLIEIDLKYAKGKEDKSRLSLLHDLFNYIKFAIEEL